MVEVAAERGFENASVKLVTERARVATRTFYEEFADLRECFEAVLDLAFERAGGLIAQEFAREERWQDGVLSALAALLVFFDSEPLLTRVWFVEALAAGSWALQRREQIVEALRSMIVEYWAAWGDESPEPVAAAGVMASVLGLIQTHLITERPEPLVELLGPMMGLVTSLYLDTPERGREIERGARRAREIRAQAADRSSIQPPEAKPLVSAGVTAGMDGAASADEGVDAGVAANEGVAVPEVLRDPRAHRMRLCLLYVAKQGGRGLGPSNQEVGEGVGVSHRGQLAALLGRLEALGLLVKRSGGPGRPNAWSPSPEGERVASALADQI